MIGWKIKMTKEDYQALESSIKKVLKKYKDSEVQKVRDTIPYYKDQYVSFVWHILRTIPNYYKTHVSLFYSKGLQDTHIETALKKILIQYKG